MVRRVSCGSPHPPKELGPGDGPLRLHAGHLHLCGGPGQGEGGRPLPRTLAPARPGGGWPSSRRAHSPGPPPGRTPPVPHPAGTGPPPPTACIRSSASVRRAAARAPSAPASSTCRAAVPSPPRRIRVPTRELPLPTLPMAAPPCEAPPPAQVFPHSREGGIGRMTPACRHAGPRRPGPVSKRRLHRSALQRPAGGVSPAVTVRGFRRLEGIRRRRAGIHLSFPGLPTPARLHPGPRPRHGR